MTSRIMAARSAFPAHRYPQDELARAFADLAQMDADLENVKGWYADAEMELAQVQTDLARRNGALADCQSRLAFRETLIGWLRWPLARAKTLLRAMD